MRAVGEADFALIYCRYPKDFFMTIIYIRRRKLRARFLLRNARRFAINCTRANNATQNARHLKMQGAK